MTFLSKLSISDLPAIKVNGVYRVLACIPSTPESVEGFPLFGQSMAQPLEPSQWQEIDLSWHNPRVLDQGSTSSCFPAGTMIKMADGEKVIENVSIGDEVISHTNQKRKVTNTFQRQYTGDIYTVFFDGYDFPLKMTADHKMAVMKDDIVWTKAEDLKFSDRFIFPFDGSRILIPVSDKKTEQVKDLTVYDFEVEVDHSFIAGGLVSSNCVGHGSASGMELCMLQSGRAYQKFSPYFIYGLINNGRDAGAMISDAMRAMMSYGACPTEKMPPNIMYKNQFPQDTFEEAKRFKLLQAYRCPTFNDICSALSLGFVCPLGIMVGANFAQVDSDGVSPLPRGGGGAHCLLGLGLKKHPRFGWVIRLLNSWGKNFSVNGYCYIHKGHFEQIKPDAFAIQSIANYEDSVPEVPT